MNISQIFISDEPISELPTALDTAVKSVLANVAHTQHTIYLKEPLRAWINQEYGAEMLKAFDKLKPFAYQADLARYLLLYRLGGWYFDIAIRVVSPTTNIPDDIDFIAFSDLSCYTEVSFGCCNGILYAKAGSPILGDTIADVCHNIANEYYGRNVLYPTGPVCLGKHIAKHSADLNIVTGMFTALTPNHPKKNRAFVFNDGTIFAHHKEKELSLLGAKGTNNYNDLYAQRAVYDTRIQVRPEKCLQYLNG
ncbi:glycosyltransferase [Kingella negevensis]|uniref:glycosyltransferase n=1 Tax=Kingella negevensis TaxID=1522312 RepID=UPI00254368A7|nr:glycosyltransferase [Kingella negevensis]WII93985.1 glycosyltransferase [Kingella negevensis]